jgi:hypothetical protein
MFNFTVTTKYIVNLFDATDQLVPTDILFKFQIIYCMAISKLLNLATAFLIFTTVTKYTEATDPQCHSGTASQNSTVHMTADVSHVQLVEIFHKSFVLLLTC